MQQPNGETPEALCLSACGSVSHRWAGQCADCAEWNTLVEEAGAVATPFAAKHNLQGGGRAIQLVGLDSEIALPARLASGIAELDRAVGGGFVEGSATLIGGDPGIGKSTLLLQAAARLARDGHAVAYVSGEEAADQIRLRARRLGLGDAPVQLAAATSTRDILTTLSQGKPPAMLVIDSIQTMHSDLIEGAPARSAQVRASAQELIRFAKERGTAVVLVGHVTKDGTIAGPRVLEHMVDTVLSFEGERSHQYRILRAIKNRFGGTDEIGVFAMETEGLSEVSNPSALFLTQRDEGVTGTTVFPALEGTRPVLVEVQALVVRLASGATPRRAVVGWDSGRLAMILAVLEARCGLSFSTAEVYLNIAGGYRVQDPAADLAVAAALVSALSERPVPADAVVFGEIALSGEVRPVAHAALRLKEAGKLGFERALLPASSAGEAGALRVSGFRTLGQLVDHMLGRLNASACFPVPACVATWRRMGLTALDILVLLAIVGSAGLGFLRGFVTEVLSLFAWIAIVIALKLFHVPLAAALAGPVGTVAGAAVLAFALIGGVTYFGGRLVANAIGNRTRTSVLGPIDRAAGLGFGALKGLIFASLAFLLVVLVIDTMGGGPAQRPAWITTSRTYPMLDSTSARIADLVDRRRRGEPLFGDNVVVPDGNVATENRQ